MLSVIGDAQAIATAIYASSSSGEAVGVSTPSLTPDGPQIVEYSGVSGTVRLQLGVPDDTKLFVVVSEHASLKEVLHHFREEIAGKSLLLAPGGFAGILRVEAWFREWGLRVPQIAEVTGFMAGGRRATDGLSFRLGAVKRDLPFASISDTVTQEMLRDYIPYFPNLVASDLVTTSLSNTNHMIHPGLVLLNAVRIENGEPFLFYRQGVSDAAGHLLQGVDDERLEVAKALGATSLSLREWMLRFYGEQGMHGNTIAECLTSFPSFATTPSPPSLNYRYIRDDVWFGAAQYLALAVRLGTPSENLQTLVLATARLSGDSPGKTDNEARHLFQRFLDERGNLPEEAEIAR